MMCDVTDRWWYNIMYDVTEGWQHGMMYDTAEEEWYHDVWAEQYSAS